MSNTENNSYTQTDSESDSQLTNSLSSQSTLRLYTESNPRIRRLYKLHKQRTTNTYRIGIFHR